MRLATVVAIAVLGCGWAQAAETPLYRLRRPSANDRLLTASCDERHSAVLRGGFTDEGVMGTLSSAEGPGLVAVYRFSYGAPLRHFYTVQKAEGERARYRFESVVGYAASAQAAGTIPLVRLFNRRTGDHLYTSSETEASRAQTQGRYVIETVMGYLQDRRDDPCPVR